MKTNLKGYIFITNFFISISIYFSFFVCTISAQSNLSLSLDEAIQKAVEQNPQLKVSEMDAVSSERLISWGRAGALPKVDLTASLLGGVGATQLDSASGGSKTNKEVQSQVTSVGVNATWTIFEGLSSLAAHDRLRYQSFLMGQKREQFRQDLLAQVILTYMDIVKQKTVLAAYDTAVSFSEERVKITNGKYSFGSASKLDLLQAKLDLNEDISNRLKQEAVFANSQRALNRILFMQDSTTIKLSDSISLESPERLNSLRDFAQSHSPILNQARQIKNLSVAGFKEYKGQLFPKVGLTLGYNYGLSEVDVGPIKASQNLGLNYGVNLKWNLFDGLVLPDDYHNAKTNERRADILFDDTRSQIESQLAQSEQSHRAGLKVLELEEANLAVAKENVTIAMERMRLGTIAALDLRAAQEKYVNAETRLVTARFEAKRTETELLRLAGKLGN